MAVFFKAGRGLASQGFLAVLVSLGLAASSNGAVTSLIDPSFDAESAGMLSDSGGQGHWSSYGDNNLRFTVETGIAHTGTQAITNTESFTATPSGFTNLYQFETADSPADLIGQTVNYSFWLYYDATTAGQNQSTDSIGYDFDARDTGNVYFGSSTGTVQASSLTAATWTKFSGSFVVSSDPGGDETLLGAVLSAPSGTWYADDFSERVASVPEPAAIGAIALLASASLMRRRRA